MCLLVNRNFQNYAESSLKRSYEFYKRFALTQKGQINEEQLLMGKSKRREDIDYVDIT